MINSWCKFRLACWALLVSLAITMPVEVFAQGSIFGEVRNADLSIPPDGSILFIGFINDTDNELRTEACIGNGYESGYWHDDFQNFIGRAAGLDYRYYFYDLSRNETAVLISKIPDNSFEQRNIELAMAVYPYPAENLTAAVVAGGRVQLEWTAQPNLSYHVYRRVASSEGSFFRIDNPSGNRSERGVVVGSYSDTEAASGFSYQYILVTESTPGNYSPASDIVEVDFTNCCQGMVGDINGIGTDEPTIGDVGLLIDHLYISGTTPECLTEADINQSGGTGPTIDDITIGDVGLLIDHLFINFVPIPDCL